jgi:hypothetical protein
MVLGGLQAFSLVSILLLILPGLAGTKLYLREVNRQDRFGRLDTVIISVAGSLLGLVVIYLGYWLYLTYIPWLYFGQPPWELSLWGAPTWVEVRGHVETLPEQLFHYVLLVLLVGGGGYFLGWCGTLIDQLPDAPNKTWRKLLEGAQGEDDIVRVRTQSGEYVVGEVDEWRVGSRSLILKNAKGDGRDGDTWGGLPGSRVYFHEDEIVRLYVVKPQSGDGTGADGEDAELNDETRELKKLGGQNPNGSSNE